MSSAPPPLKRARASAFDDDDDEEEEDPDAKIAALQAELAAAEREKTVLALALHRSVNRAGACYQWRASVQVDIWVAPGDPRWRASPFVDPETDDAYDSKGRYHCFRYFKYADGTSDPDEMRAILRQYASHNALGGLPLTRQRLRAWIDSDVWIMPRQGRKEPILSTRRFYARHAWDNGAKAWNEGAGAWGDELDSDDDSSEADDDSSEAGDEEEDRAPDTVVYVRLTMFRERGREVITTKFIKDRL